MSDIPPSAGGDTPSPSMVRRRPASVMLREGERGGAEGSGDQSGQALGQALRVVYRFLQVGMVVLVGVFAFSGLSTIKEGQRGLRIAFGKVVADDLTPGFQLALPRPMGEILKVETGDRKANLDIWVAGNGEARFNEAQLAAQGKRDLDPTQDDFLLTGDLGMGHVRVDVTYGREQDKVAEFARHVHPEAEEAMVKAAVKRGLVHAAAASTIEQFRKDARIQTEALASAQQTLDQVGSGLRIRTLSIGTRMVHPGLINDFNAVETSVSNAAKSIAEAEQYRTGTLATTAGEVSGHVLELIDRYEREYGAGDMPAADKTLAKIDAVLSGSEAVVAQSGPTAGRELRIGGKAAQQIEGARAERARTVSRAEGDASLFAAKLAAVRSNPGVVLLGDWADAYASFLNRDNVQVFMLPQGVSAVELLLNRDQELQKEQEQREAIRKQEEINRRNAEALRAEELRPRAPTGQ